MPVILLERLPLPNLSTYVTFSVVLLACAVTFSYMEVTQVYELGLNKSTLAETADPNDVQPTDVPSTSIDVTSGDVTSPSADVTLPSLDVYLLDMVSVLVTETWCIWTLINMVYCCLILVGKTIQNIVFGELRVSEQEHLRDRFWNFVFYKFIFIFGVMHVQSMDDVLMWCAWFSLLGFLQFLAQLCKDRFEYLSFSPMTSRWTHVRVVSLLSGILLISSALLGVSLAVGFRKGWHMSAFMGAESFLLILSTLFVIIKYGFHLFEVQHEGVWEKKAVYVYYTELGFDMLRLSVDFMHHLHMLIWGNIYLSMANLVICMQLRYLFYECQRRIHRHANYLKIVKNMERLYPTVEGKDLGENDQCAICWDTLELARKLTCGHLFHNSCLRSWLEQDSTCPTCRCPLADPVTSRDRVRDHRGEEVGGGDAEEPQQQGAGARTTNHFFQFDGSRYVSWLPSFSVEVTHTRLARGTVQTAHTDASHLSQLAREVQSVFPHMPLSTLQEDLQVTHSVDATIDNILEGRLQAPPTSMYPSLTQPSGTLTTPADRPPRPSPRPLTEGRSFLQAQDDNLANVGGEEGVEDSVENDRPPMPSTSQPSFQFSKNPAEREQMLARRKRDLLAQAKTRFLARSEPDPVDVDASSQDDVMSDTDDVIATTRDDVTTAETSRRELAYQAAVRRRRGSPEHDDEG